MPGLTDIPGVQVHGKGTRDFTLPVGYVDSSGKVHDQVVIREMTGAEDDMLGNDDLPVGERVTNVLSACIEKLGDITDKETIRKAVADDLTEGQPLTEQDRLAAMIFLRRTTIGDIYKFERRCPRCGEMARNRQTDLRELKIDKSEHPEKRLVSVKLKRSGKTAVLRVLSASGASKIGRLRPTQKDLKSLAICARLVSIDDKSMDDPRVALQTVKSLPQADRNTLRLAYNRIEASVETDIDVDCRNPICGAPWTFPLDVGQGFFLDLEETLSDEDLNWL